MARLRQCSGMLLRANSQEINCFQQEFAMGFARCAASAHVSHCAMTGNNLVVRALPGGPFPEFG
jgi:hypothetical protein